MFSPTLTHDLHYNVTYDDTVDIATNMPQKRANCLMKSNKSKKLFYPDQFAPYMEVFNFLIDNNEIELTPSKKNYKFKS